MERVQLEGGVSAVTYRPPPGFDPFAAAPQDAARNGFPPLPTDPAQLERYRRVFSQLQHKLQYVPPTFRVNADRRHGPRRRLTEEGTETSTNWSGAVVFAPSGDTFRWLQGDWVIPDVDAPTENQWYYCASWIGLDGDGSGDVFQAGVECEVYRSGSSLTRRIYPWWEWFPTPEVEITNLAVSPGDMVTMVLCSASGAGSTTGTVYFTNRTTGASTSVTLTAPSGTQLVGNSAEWIVEAPTVGGAQSAIADYGEVFFSVCEAQTHNNVTVNGGAGDSINLTAGGAVVSQGVLITPTVVQCQYVTAPAPAQVTVPNVFELGRAAAAAAVQRAGLVPAFTGATQATAWVGSQSPPGGASAARGSTVSMTMRIGPPP